MMVVTVVAVIVIVEGWIYKQEETDTEGMYAKIGGKFFPLVFPIFFDAFCLWKIFFTD